jgi:[acyl-carrier-protein] S-malonyltransferase
MGAALRERYPEAAEVYAQADDALGFALSDLILNGPAERLTETENTQPAILTCAVAYLRVLEKHGLSAQLAAGHSLGEYAALVANGALDLPTAVRLVRLRGRFMQAAVPLGVGTMVAVLMLDGPMVEQLCVQVSDAETRVEPAGYNSRGQVACAGHVEAVERLEEAVGKAGGTSKRLNVSAPFHSSLLKKAGDDLGVELERVHVRPFRFPYVANVDAQIVSDPAGVKQRLIEQVMKPVLWEQSVATMVGAGVDRFIEVGPGKTLAGLLRKIDRKLQVISVDDPKSFEMLLAGG